VAAVSLVSRLGEAGNFKRELGGTNRAVACGSPRVRVMLPDAAKATNAALLATLVRRFDCSLCALSAFDWGVILPRLSVLVMPAKPSAAATRSRGTLKETFAADASCGTDDPTRSGEEEQLDCNLPTRRQGVATLLGPSTEEADDRLDVFLNLAAITSAIEGEGSLISASPLSHWRFCKRWRNVRPANAAEASDEPSPRDCSSSSLTRGRRFTANLCIVTTRCKAKLSSKLVSSSPESDMAATCGDAATSGVAGLAGELKAGLDIPTSGSLMLGNSSLSSADWKSVGAEVLTAAPCRCCSRARSDSGADAEPDSIPGTWSDTGSS